MLKAILKPGEDLTDVGDADFAADQRFAIGFISLPKAISREVTEWKIGIVLVIVFFHQEKPCREAITEVLAPRYEVRLCFSFIDQIQCREEQERLVRLFMGATFFQTRCSYIERIESFNGKINRYGIRFDFFDGCVQRKLTS